MDVTKIKPGQLAGITAARPKPTTEFLAAIDRARTRRGLQEGKMQR